MGSLDGRGERSTSTSTANRKDVPITAVYIDLANGAKRVQLEQRDPDMHGPFGLGPILLAFSLYVAGQALGWPAAKDVSAAFE
jgi:hypothetical protein